MQKILRSPASMRKKPVKVTFGVPLSELAKDESGLVKVPHLVMKITDFLQMHGIGHEGIFRINGSTKIVEKLRAKFDKSQDADLEEAGDVMAVAGLLKLFLRELPEPVMTEALHNKFIQLQKDFKTEERSDYLPQLKNLVQQLPEENFTLLRYLCHFLVRVTQHEETNKMNARGLAIVFGPNLFRCSDGVEGLQEQGVTNVIVRTLIEDYSFLFDDEEDFQSDLTPPPNSTRIEVKAATEKRSPPVKPISYEEYLKQRLGRAFGNKESEEKDINSNSVDDKDREEARLALDRQGALSPCDVSSIDDRALSPFYQDSDSTVPSPIVSETSLEVVERTIKESISEHLFGSSPSSNDTSGEVPIPSPRKKRIQKKLKEAEEAKRKQESLGNHTMTPASSDEPSLVKERLQKLTIDSYSPDSWSSSSSPVVRHKKRTNAVSLGQDTESQEAIAKETIKSVNIKADKDLNNTNSPSSRRKPKVVSCPDAPSHLASEDLDRIKKSDQTLEQKTFPSSINSKQTKKSQEPVKHRNFTDEDLDSVHRSSPLLQNLNEGRVTPPRRRSGSWRSTGSDQSPTREAASSNLHQSSVPKMNMEDDISVMSKPGHEQTKLKEREESGSGHKVQKSQYETVTADGNKSEKNVIKARTESPPNVHAATKVVKASDSSKDKRYTEHSRTLESSREGRRHTEPSRPVEGSRDIKRGTDRVDGDIAKSPKRPKGRKKKTFGKEVDDLQVRNIDSPDVSGLMENKGGRKKRSNHTEDSRGALTNGNTYHGNGERHDRVQHSAQGFRHDFNKDVNIPPLDFSSLLANAESDEPIPAWLSHQDTSGPMEELFINVRMGSSQIGGEWDEAALSPRAKDIPPCWGSSSLNPERSAEKSQENMQYIKQLTRQIRNLKRKIRQYEEEFQMEHGYKPSTSEKATQPEIKKMMGELKRASKQLKAAKEHGEDMNKPLHNTLPARFSKRSLFQDDQHEERLENLREALTVADEWLEEKRRDANRPEDIYTMTKGEVHDEKVSIQKVLLQLENKYGRPTTKESKEIMKPLYDRYRNLKRLIAKFEVRRTLSDEMAVSSPLDLNTIQEHEETKEFTPKQLGTIHTMYADEDAEVFMVTQEVPTSGRLRTRTMDMDDNYPSPVDMTSGYPDSPVSLDISANLANAPIEELIASQSQAMGDKRRLRRLLKDFEDGFMSERGRKVQKEDRTPMEAEYNNYKRVKKQLKLIDALIEKHQSQASTGVT